MTLFFHLLKGNILPSLEGEERPDGPSAAESWSGGGKGVN